MNVIFPFILSFIYLCPCTTEAKPCVCGFVGQLFIRGFDQELYKFEPCSQGLVMVLYSGKIADDYKVMLALNVSIPLSTTNELNWAEYNILVTVQYGGQESRLVLYHHNFISYPLEHNGQPNLLPFVDPKLLFVVYPLGLVSNYGQGSKVFFYKQNTKEILAEIEIEPMYGNIYFILKDSSKATGNKGLCGECDGKVDLQNSQTLKSSIVKEANLARLTSCNNFKFEQVDLEAKAQCAKDDPYCKILCSSDVKQLCGDECNHLYQVCKYWLSKRKIQACSLVQHVIADIKVKQQKLISNWESNAYCYSKNNKSDYMGCSDHFGSTGYFSELAPAMYLGCRGPTVKLEPSAALGTGCYCKQNLYEYTSDKAYCFTDKKQCQCATTVQRNNEWYLVETTQAFMTYNCKHKCECKTKTEDEEYYHFECHAYKMPTGAQCCTQQEAQMKTSFPGEIKGCIKQSYDANRYLFNLSSSQQVWCNFGYKGCPMFDDTCKDVDECTMMDPVDRTYRPPLKKCSNANCKNTDGSYECECLDGYNSVDSFTCQKKKLKEPAPKIMMVQTCKVCEHDGDHKHEPAESEEQVPQPEPGPGGEGKTSSKTPQKPSADIPTVPQGDPCSKNPCNINADCTADWRRLCNVSCACKPGYASGNTGFQCDRPCHQSQENFCTKSKTELNKKCILDDNDKPICVCSTGFRMNPITKKCIDIDECVECKHQCVLNSVCTNVIGYYQCTCLQGFYGNPVDECKDVDECAMGTYSCDINADCQNLVPGYKCQCKIGWQGDPNSKGTPDEPCQDTNECLNPSSCGSYTKCENTPGSYKCKCIPGGFRKIDSRNCEDINECIDTKFQKPRCHEFADCINSIGSYSCMCKSGFVGDGFDCQPDKSICENCDKPTTTCELSYDRRRYLCVCKPGYLPLPQSDTACRPEYKCNDPSKNDCDKVNGICTDVATAPNGYICRCKAGFAGDGRACKPIDPCLSGPCRKDMHSVCKVTSLGTASCDCVENFIKREESCVENPEFVKIHNCSQCDTNRQQCVKDIKPDLWKCECLAGYRKYSDGTCRNINECLYPNENDCDTELAYCIDKVPHLNNGLRYSCKCKPGYEGTGSTGNCKDIDECVTLTNPCPNPHTKCMNTIGSYMCECEPGWEPLMPNMPQPVACQDVDECATGKFTFKVNCKCVNSEGSYAYSPLPGFKMDGDKCVDIDECQTTPDICDNRTSNCENTPGSYMCECKECCTMGPSGKCTDPDQCSQGTHTCSLDRETCQKIPGSYKCVCKRGYERKTPTGPCEDINECENTTSPCPQFAECFNVIGSYFCKCKAGFYVADNSDPQKPLCKPIDKCSEQINPCGYGVCKVTTSDPFYECHCPQPTIQLNSTFCANERYCYEPTYPCPGNSLCERNYCDCLQGHVWIDNPVHDASVFKTRKPCEAVNPCKSNANPCTFDQTCVYTGPGQSTCECALGFMLDENTKLCKDINECISRTVVQSCTENSECTNTIGSYKCTCLKGLLNTVPSVLQPKCVDDNECLNPLKYFCGQHQVCVNDPGTYHCECMDGFEIVSMQPLICKDKNECLNTTVLPCDPNANCINTMGSYYCECKPGFQGSGKICTDIDECDSKKPLVTCSFREICHNLIGGYECICEPGYEKQNGFCINKDECVSGENNCSSYGVKVKKVCVDKVPFYDCECPQGYEWNTAAADCQDINECLKEEDNHCSTLYNADCKNKDGGFDCICKPGYEKDPKCDSLTLCKCININECRNSSACAPFSICQDSTPGYSCTCNMGYVGDAYKDCRPFNECIPVQNKCGDNQRCTVLQASPSCICTEQMKYLPNFDNSMCLPNPCAIDNGGCKVPAICVPVLKDKRYEATCKCPVGYMLSDAGNQCDPVNACGCEHNQRQCESARCPTNSVCHNTAPGQMTCICKKGYKKTDKGCEDEDECLTNPCSAGATCQNTIGSYECICPLGQLAGITGKCKPDITCSKQQFCVPVDHSYCAKINDTTYLCQCRIGYSGDPFVSCIHDELCKKKPDLCQENEVCVDTFDGYRCDCKIGYIKDASGKCVDDNECNNPYACPPRRKCINTVGSYLCNCTEGYRMVDDNCKDIDECVELDPKPCNPVTELCINHIPGYACVCKFPTYVNVNGKCVDGNECKMGLYNCPLHSTCVNTEGGYNCTCKQGLMPKYADNMTLQECIDIDECAPTAPRMCDINANCTNTFGGYYCQCFPGFYGSGVPNDCYEQKTCVPDCDPNAYCIRNSVSVYNCTCKPGFKGDGHVCTAVDPCQDNTHNCHKNAKCVKTALSYYCKCMLPYEGDGFNYCNKMSFCQRGFDDCPVNAKCKDLDDPTPEGRYFTCVCMKGFNFNETTRRCQDIDECLSSPCPSLATCVNRQGSYTCVCPMGYSYASQSNSCDDIDECAEIPFLCKPNGQCKNTPGSYECICDKGFAMDEKLHFCRDIDECAKPELNQCNSTTSFCHNFPGSYSCVCKFGYDQIPGSFPIQCKDRDECATGQDNCCHYANCTNSVGSFTCTCIPGFSGDGVTCYQIPSCQTLKCGINAVCTEIGVKRSPDKTPMCSCQYGYEGNPLVECKLISMCNKLNQPCLKGECFDFPLGYNCTCFKGYRFNGKSCEDIDECLKPPCGENALCKNTPGSFNCECVSGFEGDPMKACAPVDRCLTTDMRYKLLCSPNGYCKVNKCFCNTGFTGDGVVCTDINECEKFPGICSYFSDCENTIGSYLCKCKTGYHGDGQHCEDDDECINSTVQVCDSHATCTNNQGSYYCTCLKGWNAPIKNALPSGAPGTCSNVNECLSPELNICDKSISSCKDLEGDYECTPNLGYRWRDNTTNKHVTDVDECNEKPLQHRCNVQISNCLNTVGSYYCQCMPGYTNPPVDRIACIDVDECQQQRCNINADCFNTVGSFKCTCKPRYTGDGTKSCTAINVCQDVRFNTCNLTSTACVFDESNARGTCQCKPGFQPTVDPDNCDDINECDPLRPKHNCNVAVERCQNSVGSYTCICLDGYKRQNGTCVQIDNCVEKNGNAICAAKTATCINKVNDFVCDCMPGFRDNGKGCEDIDECKEHLHNCTFPHSICINVVGKFLCDCQEGYTKAINSKGLEYCKKGVMSCTGHTDCPMFSQCTTLGMCEAVKGYEFKKWDNGSYVKDNGSYVVVDIDECARGLDSCSECGVDGITCKNLPGNYTCLCPTGAELYKCQCEDMCRPESCHWARTCYVDGTSVSCKCRSYSKTLQQGDNMKTSICIKRRGVIVAFFDKYTYYNDVCANGDDCALPEKEPDVQLSRDFNYFGPCLNDPSEVKCEMGVTAKMGILTVSIIVACYCNEEEYGNTSNFSNSNPERIFLR